MTVVYDAGVLVAVDRNDRPTWADHRVRLELGILPAVTSPVVAQVSRSSRQAELRRFLRGCQIVPFDAADAHTVGSLLAAADLSDVVDAHVVVVGAGGDIITADPTDIRRLATHASRTIRVHTV